MGKTVGGFHYFKQYQGATKLLAGTCYGVCRASDFDFLGYVGKTPDDRHWCYDDGSRYGKLLAAGGMAGSFASRQEAAEALLRAQTEGHGR